MTRNEFFDLFPWLSGRDDLPEYPECEECKAGSGVRRFPDGSINLLEIHQKSCSHYPCDGTEHPLKPADEFSDEQAEKFKEEIQDRLMLGLGFA